MFLRLTVGAAALVMLSACSSSSHHADGSTPTVAVSRPAPSPPATTPGPVSPTTLAPRTGVRIGAVDAGRTFSIARGATVTITLSTGDLWAEPRTSDSAVLRRVSGGVDRMTGAAVATFSAVGVGTVRIASTRRCLPVSGQECGRFIALWSVAIDVR